jgi:hypothetical protein
MAAVRVAPRGACGSRGRGPWPGRVLLPYGVPAGQRLSGAGLEQGDLRGSGDGRLGLLGVREAEPVLLLPRGVAFAVRGDQRVQRGR